MLSGPLYRELLAFSLPIAVTAILEQLFNATDTMVLGRFEGTAAMAAVGNNVTIISLIVSLLLETRKLEKAGPYVFSDLRDVKGVLTEKAVSEATAERLTQLGIICQ